MNIDLVHSINVINTNTLLTLIHSKRKFRYWFFTWNHFLVAWKNDFYFQLNLGWMIFIFKSIKTWFYRTLTTTSATRYAIPPFLYLPIFPCPRHLSSLFPTTLVPSLESHGRALLSSGFHRPILLWSILRCSRQGIYINRILCCFNLLPPIANISGSFHIR